MKNEIRILVVEDTASDVVLINRELRKAGLHFSSRQIESRENFLRELEKHPPDVILSDHGVPGFDGIAALAEARRRCPEVPFIFVTGAPREQIAVEAVKHGADDYVLKHSLHLLAPAIKRALSDSRIRARYRQLESDLVDARKRAAQLEAANREMEEFVHKIAQEMRMQLRHIESFSELLLKTACDKLDPKSRSHLKTISGSTHQLSRLIDDLSTFSRIGRADLYRIHLSLAEIVKDVVRDLRTETEGREVEWVMGPLPEVEGDPVMLTLVMSNLISNALKFTRLRKAARIEIGATSDKNEIVIFVKDNGVGFDMRHANKLFGVFQRLHHTADFEGAGIGLANVRRIIHRHGGRTWATGESGVGATFYFSLPKISGKSITVP